MNKMTKLTKKRIKELREQIIYFDDGVQLDGKEKQFGKFCAVPIELINPWERNYKRTAEDDKEALKTDSDLEKSISDLGQVENLLLREMEDGTFTVFNGNHRLPKLIKAGYKMAMCYNFGMITEKEAAAIAIRTNEIKFKADPFKLAEHVKEIMMSSSNPEEIKSQLPYSDADIERMKTLTEFDWSQYEKDDLPQNNQGVQEKPKKILVIRLMSDEDLPLEHEIREAANKYKTARVTEQ